MKASGLQDLKRYFNFGKYSWYVRHWSLIKAIHKTSYKLSVNGQNLMDSLIQ